MADPKPMAAGGCSPWDGGLCVDVGRRGSLVKLTITAQDDYGAIELYEHIVRSLERGRLVLCVGIAEGG